MTFDEAIEQMEELQGSAGYATYGVPEANNFSGYDVNEYLNAATEIINNLRKEYAPTVEMTPRAYKFLKGEHNKFVKTGNDNFLSNNGLGNWRFRDEHRIDIERDEEYIDEFTAEYNHFKGLTRTKVIQAWLHPETIKVTGENND